MSPDPAQVDLIRQHLRTEATRFEQGDYGDLLPSTAATCPACRPSRRAPDVST